MLHRTQMTFEFTVNNLSLRLYNATPFVIHDQLFQNQMNAQQRVQLQLVHSSEWRSRCSGNLLLRIQPTLAPLATCSTLFLLPAEVVYNSRYQQCALVVYTSKGHACSVTLAFVHATLLAAKSLICDVILTASHSSRQQCSCCSLSDAICQCPYDYVIMHTHIAYVVQ